MGGTAPPPLCGTSWFKSYPLPSLILDVFELSRDRTTRLRRMGREAWRRMIERAPEPDACPNASKQQFRPDLTRICLAGGEGGETCTHFRLNPFEDCPRWRDGPGVRRSRTLETYSSTTSVITVSAR